MTFELFFYFFVFFIFGYITDRLDHMLDELGKVDWRYVLAFSLAFVLSAFLAYNAFLSEFVGVLVGLSLALKMDRLPYVITLLFVLLVLAFTPLSIERVIAFALVSYLDELKEMVSLDRPLLKVFTAFYGLMTNNPLILVSLGGFDIGYELSSRELKNS